MQEKVANEMIKMAQSMKHNSLVANEIIKADNLVSNFVLYLKFELCVMLFFF